MNSEIETQIQQANHLNTVLDLRMEVPQNEPENKYVTLQRLQRVLKTLNEEFEHRQQQAFQILNDLLVKMETAGCDCSLQLQQILQC